MMAYFNPDRAKRLLGELNDADGRSLRIAVFEDGNGKRLLAYKIGEGMWSAPIPEDDDPHRDGRGGCM